MIVVVTNYNAVEWIAKSLDSCVNQEYDNFDVVVVDDCSTDGTWDIIQQYEAKYPQLHAVRNKERNCTGVINIRRGMNLLPADKDDIIVLMSGDDWFNDYSVLRYLNEVYTKDIWMTYGQFVPVSGGYGAYCKPIHDTRNYRRSTEWLASHLITCRRWLWEKIKDEDWKYNGDYTHYATDAAFLYPMIEMCGQKHMKFIEKILYIYNDLNPTSVFRIYAKQNIAEATHFKNLPSYDEL